MIDQGVKIVLATGILLGGIAAALLFRQTPSKVGRPSPGPYEQLPLRNWKGPQVSDPSQGLPTVHIESSDRMTQPVDISRQMPTVLEPMDPGAPPPLLPKSYPRSYNTATPRWGSSMALGPTDSEQLVRTHKIVDGDTLPDLAERYLGSADRYMEIYEANPYVLPGPDVLPIGVELRIPPQSGRPASSRTEVWEESLVPIPPASLRRRRARETYHSSAGRGVIGAPSRGTFGLPGVDR